MNKQSPTPKIGDEVTLRYGRAYWDDDFVEQWYATGTVVELDSEWITLQHDDGSLTSAELYFCTIDLAYAYA